MLTQVILHPRLPFFLCDRAPLLVAIALIEAGLTPEESIARVREKRRGALNTKQAKFIMDYKRKKSRKSKCTIL